VVSQCFNALSQNIDIVFNEVIEQRMLTHCQGFSASAYTCGNVSVQELLQNKYLLSVQGNGVASGLKWMLYSNSVVFMVPPSIEAFVMEGSLTLCYHSIPLKEDFSDLTKTLAWARNHDKICHQISMQAMKFMKDL
jgi:hypothetical protein